MIISKWSLILQALLQEHVDVLIKYTNGETSLIIGEYRKMMIDMRDYAIIKYETRYGDVQQVKVYYKDIEDIVRN